VQVRLDYRVNDELRGSQGVVIKDEGDYCEIDFRREIKISDTQSKQVFRMNKQYLQIVVQPEGFVEQIGKTIANVDRELAVSVTPSTPANVGANHKEFTKGDRVVIAEVGNLHQGQHGEVVYVGNSSRDTDYIVKLDKESRGSKQVRVTVPKGSKFTFLMKL
jgi:hypothetical protein